VGLALATGKDLVDLVLKQFHTIDQAKLASASYTPLRARILRNARLETIAMYNLRDWLFRYINGGTVTIPDSSYDAILPAGWANEGQDGGVWRTGAFAGPLQWTPLGQIKNLQQTYPDQVGDVFRYSVENRAGVWYITCFPKASPAQNLSLYYEGITPEIADDPADTGLARFPTDWRESVIYNGTVLREMRDMGDIQSLPAQTALYNDAVFSMCCTERQGKPNVDQWPRFPGGTDIFMEWL
jgi:hypothetical protein